MLGVGDDDAKGKGKVEIDGKKIENISNIALERLNVRVLGDKF